MIRYRWAIALALSVLQAMLESAPARSQLRAEGIADRLREPATVAQTVSVSSLRIPEKAWRHFDKAKTAAERGHSEESDRELQKAIQIAPGFSQAYLLRACEQLQEHRYEAAIASVDAARRAEPDAMWAGLILAGAYNSLKRYSEARAILAGLRPQEAETWQAMYEWARAEAGSGDVAEALRWSALALAAAPADFADIHLVRTNALLLGQRWREAAEQMEIYLRAKGPKPHRDEVVAMLEATNMRIQQEDTAAVALR